jgi:aspartate racemase
VTPHIAIDELKAIAPIPVVDLLQAVADRVRARGLSRVALFGTRYVIESNLYGRLTDVQVVRPRDDEIAFVHEAYSHLAHTATVSADHRAGLTALAETLAKRDGVDAILLAGTDLCLMFDSTNTPFPHVDCAGTHIDAIQRVAASQPDDRPTV